MRMSLSKGYKNNLHTMISSREKEFNNLRIDQYYTVIETFLICYNPQNTRNYDAIQIIDPPILKNDLG